MKSITHKICFNCKVDKSISEFGIRRCEKDGHHYYCKKCHNEKAKAHRKKEKDGLVFHFSELSKEDRAERKREVRAQVNFRYNESHKEEIRAYTKKNNIARAGDHREYYRQRRQNPEYREYSRVKTRQRTELKKLGRNDFTDEQWYTILDKYEHRCLRCGTTDRITMDHIVPLSRGGEHTADNIQPLCKKCNQWKFTKTIDYRTGG